MNNQRHAWVFFCASFDHDTSSIARPQALRELALADGTINVQMYTSTVRVMLDHNVHLSTTIIDWNTDWV